MKRLRYGLDLLKLLLAKSLSPIMKVNELYRDIWLVGERNTEAQDNGYHFFKYVREHYPEKQVYYIIKKNSRDYAKIKNLGNVIEYESLKHYLFYVMSTKLVCAHVASCVPDSPVCWKLYNSEMKSKKKIFIQHGITKELIPSLMYSTLRADLFVCGAKPEYDFVKKHFGYPKGNVQYLGFPRFDNLHVNISKNQILVMPTWRQWISGQTWKSESVENSRAIFLKSEYFNRYNDFIHSTKLSDLLEKYNLNLVFYPHYEMQGYVDLFTSSLDRITIASNDKYDVQTLLKESRILITDYSSVAFDFAYMRKDVIYYQFDESIYYQQHYNKGYFDYRSYGFGPVVNKLEELEMYLGQMLEGSIGNRYKDRADKFFQIHDTKNCERIYSVIDNLRKSC